jgi:predicted porin
VNTKIKVALIAGAVSALSTAAFADGAASGDGTLTWYGVTLYGTVDAGIQYNSAGAPQSDYFGPGSQELIAKQSNGATTNVGGNYLSQSKIGLKGKEEIANGWSAVFKVESTFNPWSGQFTDGPRSQAANNGKAVGLQSAAGDSSLAGQLFSGAAYIGVSNDTFGTLTLGRNTGILHDLIAVYDPQNNSYAFSPVGNSGTAAGVGDTEDRRLDDSAKYDVRIGGLHLGAQFQTKSGSNPGTAQEFAVGYSFEGGSVDAFYAQKNNAIATASLAASDISTIATVCAGTASATTTATYACSTDTSKTLAATISDNTATGILGKYKFPGTTATVYGGYEQIRYTNPSDPVAPGFTGLGGYIIAKVNNAAFPSTKTLDISWVGVKYFVTPKWEVTGALYRYDQNAYATGKNAGCSSAAVSAQCSGSQNFISGVVDYHATKRFDVYGGAMWNQVQGGLANGFAIQTATIDPTLGFRYSF